jgi:hypothetical protein
MLEAENHYMKVHCVVMLQHTADVNIQGVTERCGPTLGTSSTYQNKQICHINMCPETFNL